MFSIWVFLENYRPARMRMNKQEYWEVQEDQEHENGITVIKLLVLERR